jgi:hypothetical protein
MVFEVYVPKSRGAEAKFRPIVRLSKSSIVLNKISRQKINSRYLELAFDPEKRIIRIRPADPNNEAAMELKKTKIYAKGFFKNFGIESQGKFEARYDEKENALYVQLNEKT